MSGGAISRRERVPGCLVSRPVFLVLVVLDMGRYGGCGCGHSCGLYGWTCGRRQPRCSTTSTTVTVPRPVVVATLHAVKGSSGSGGDERCAGTIIRSRMCDGHTDDCGGGLEPRLLVATGALRTMLLPAFPPRPVVSATVPTVNERLSSYDGRCCGREDRQGANVPKRGRQCWLS